MRCGYSCACTRCGLTVLTNWSREWLKSGIVCICAQWYAHTYERLLEMTVDLGFGLIFVHFVFFITGLFALGLVFLCILCFLNIFRLSLVVLISAGDWLERLVSEITHYVLYHVSSRTLTLYIAEAIIVLHRMIWSYIWYSEEGTGRARPGPSSLYQM